MTGKVNRNDSKTTKSSSIDSSHNGDEEDSVHLKQTNAALKTLLNQHLPENQQSLKDSQINLDKIANYCDSNYFQVSLVLFIRIFQEKKNLMVIINQFIDRQPRRSISRYQELCTTSISFDCKSNLFICIEYSGNHQSIGTAI